MKSQQKKESAEWPLLLREQKKQIENFLSQDKDLDSFGSFI